ncbi:MAG TPA: hybrid sensor histidine kinase/response regulator [Gemmatimonadaceae bacterium]|jgi:signal transduction histidine kinase|nr:hybrid sensor histidine kinase/response regulator [Gemmatimonadaceae bacterium]
MTEMTETEAATAVSSVEENRAAEREYKMLVLLVDDQPIVGEMVRRLLLDEEDIALHYCKTAAGAVALATRINPTVILQDLVLPDGDGLELVQQYRANPATASTPIVVLSTKEEASVKSRAFAVGANDYLVKLPERAELIARIRYHSWAFINQQQRDEAFRALHQSQARLLESNTSLVALNQKLNEFVGMAAHDLRNPLGVVLNFTKFLLRDVPQYESAKYIKFLSNIQASTEFMLRLVTDLLDVSAIESGKLTLDCHPANLRVLVEANVALNQLLASEKGIAITVTAPAMLPLVSMDTHRIEQVLTNLLTNAIKYSHPDTVVDVTLWREGNEVILSVRDHGQGIPAAELDLLFLPFSVTSVRGTRGEKSTGLGLMIVKKVIDAHHGRIWVESTVGEGSAFFVALPAAIE